MTNEKSHPIILGPPERERNPLRKLIAGFCDPFIPKHADDDETIESHEYSPRGGGAKERGFVAAAESNIPKTSNNRSLAKRQSSVKFEQLAINRSLHIPARPATRNMSEITIESYHSTAGADRINTPEPELEKIFKKIAEVAKVEIGGGS